MEIASATAHCPRCGKTWPIRIHVDEGEPGPFYAIETEPADHHCETKGVQRGNLRCVV